MNNPVRYVDLRGEDIFNAKGHFVRSNNSDIISVQSNNGLTTLSALPMNNMNNRQIAANVVGYYEHQIDIHSPGEIGIANESGTGFSSSKSQAFK